LSVAGVRQDHPQLELDRDGVNPARPAALVVLALVVKVGGQMFVELFAWAWAVSNIRGHCVHIARKVDRVRPESPLREVWHRWNWTVLGL